MPEPSLRLHEEKNICPCGEDLGTKTTVETDASHVVFYTIGRATVFGPFRCVCGRWYHANHWEKQVDKTLAKLMEITGGTAEQLTRRRADYGKTNIYR